MPVGQRRERYNAKARGSVPGGKQRKKLKTNDEERRDLGGRGSGVKEVVDTNVQVIIPKSEREKEEERKGRIRKELELDPGMKMSSKKKKRLEKYVDKKLMQEERVHLFEKLAQTQTQANSLTLQSSSILGSRIAVTNAEKIAKMEDKETRRMFDGVSGGGSVAGSVAGGGSGKRKRKRGQESAWVVDVNESEESDEEEEEEKKLQEVVKEEVNVAGEDEEVQVQQEENEEEEYPEWTGFSHEEDVEMENASGDEESSSEASDDEGGENEFNNPNGTENFASNQESEDESDHPKRKRQRKVAGFKEWAVKQLMAAKNPGTEVEPVMSNMEQMQTMPPPTTVTNSKQKIHGPISGPLGEVLSLPSTSFVEHIRMQKIKEDASSSKEPLKRHVLVNRTEEIQEARLQLPVVAEEQPIMEAVLLNPVVVICGETGSGKTTQIPQFLYEAGFGSGESENPGMIGITQPRRVAAMSMASRVATELNLSPAEVSYQIRYDATVSPTTVIKFMTDGVLLRELAMDFLLSRYSVVIVDEAHERSMNTDILIGVLSRVVRLREQMWKEKKDGVKPLRLVIMSATLRVSDFTANTTLFKTPPPIINITARQHPVTIHFSRRTLPDYVSEAVKKTIKIHTRLPPGGILVFLTGQTEIAGMCRKLEARFSREAIKQRDSKRQRMNESAARRMKNLEEKHEKTAAAVPTQVDIEAEDMDLGGDADLALDVDSDVYHEVHPDGLDSDDDETGDELLKDNEDTDMPMHIVPLYSLLSSEKQMKVFQEPPADARLVVIATNVAETSLTIPGIRYVVDCGRAKERKYDTQNGIQTFQVSWISKASAAQRAGRAGRTGPGHCYRLYSSALFENYFEQFAEPEILRVPIEGIVLQMKSMNIDVVVNFPFPTPPDRERMRAAEAILEHLGALEGIAGSSHITSLGKTMSLFPLSPRFSKMLVAGKQYGCLPYVITIVSALSVGDPFLREEALGSSGEDKRELNDEDLTGEIAHIRSEDLREKEIAKARRRAFINSQQTHAALDSGTSDIFRLLSVIGAYEFAGGGSEFCAEHFLRPKAMEEIHKLRSQITNIVNANFPDMTVEFTPQTPPSEIQLRILRQLITTGFVDQVAVRKDLIDKTIPNPEKQGSSRNVPYGALGVSEDVYIHPSSLLFYSKPPEYLVFHEIVRTNRPWMKTLTVINPAWLPVLAPGLCTMSKPMKLSADVTVVIPKYGPENWELPPIKQ